MKTVIDAVNEFKGEHHIDPELGSNYTQFIECLVDLGEFGRGDISVGNGVRSGCSCWEPICTIDEFAECLEWCESWQPTLTSDYFNNMSYKKYVAWYSTVEQVERSLGEEINKPELAYDKDGYGYELNALYEFSDDGKSWNKRGLSNVNMDDEHRQFTDDSGFGWAKCREIKSKLGTITPPKVKLVDGQAYMFDTRGYEGFVGRYRDRTKSFVASMNMVIECEIKHCTNIIPLVKG